MVILKETVINTEHNRKLLSSEFVAELTVTTSAN